MTTQWLYGCYPSVDEETQGILSARERRVSEAETVPFRFSKLHDLALPLTLSGFTELISGNDHPVSIYICSSRFNPEMYEALLGVLVHEYVVRVTRLKSWRKFSYSNHTILCDNQ